MTAEETNNEQPHQEDIENLKHDDATSVDSGSYDGDADAAASPPTDSPTQGRRVKILIVAVLAVALGLALGLGLGLTIDERKNQLRVPANSNGSELFVDTSSTSSDYPAEGEAQGSGANAKVPDVDMTLPMNERMHFPELLELPCKQAVRMLQEAFGEDYIIQIVYPGDKVTKDFRFDRVRWYVDEQCVVMEVPSVGRR